MAKEGLLELNGGAAEVLPDSRYRVTLHDGHDLIACSAGRMRKHHIRIIFGDQVSLVISPYGLSRGRIAFRHIETRTLAATPRRRYRSDRAPIPVQVKRDDSITRLAFAAFPGRDRRPATRPHSQSANSLIRPHRLLCYSTRS